MRKPQVTRTIGFYEKVVKAYKPSTDEVLTVTVNTNKDTEKAVREALDKDLNLITVISTERKEQSYAMDLDFFIANATPITQKGDN